VQLTLTGQPNLLYVFEGSTNWCNGPSWACATNLTGTVEFTDTSAPSTPNGSIAAVAPLNRRPRSRRRESALICSAKARVSAVSRRRLLPRWQAARF
jgi:hypothetical protein